MANVLYKRVDYKLENLLLDVETGKLGLPDLLNLKSRMGFPYITA